MHVLIFTILFSGFAHAETTPCAAATNLLGLQSEVKALEQAKDNSEKCTEINEVIRMLDIYEDPARVITACSPAELAKYKTKLAQARALINARKSKLDCTKKLGKEPDIRGELVRAFAAVKAYKAEWDKWPKDLKIDAAYESQDPRVHVHLEEVSPKKFYLVGTDGSSTISLDQDKEYGK